MHGAATLCGPPVDCACARQATRAAQSTPRLSSDNVSNAAASPRGTYLSRRWWHYQPTDSRDSNRRKRFPGATTPSWPLTARRTLRRRERARRVPSRQLGRRLEHDVSDIHLLVHRQRHRNSSRFESARDEKQNPLAGARPGALPARAPTLLSRSWLRLARAERVSRVLLRNRRGLLIAHAAAE